MKKVYRLLLLCLLVIGNSSSYAQVKHIITVSNNFFSPSSKTINLGDTVEFRNSSGFHNINGTVGTYPQNPQSFGNSVNSNWVYQFKFTVPGTYNYQCDPHVGANMLGSITVLNNASSSDLNISKQISVYPNPATDWLIFSIPDELILKNQIVNISIFNIIGKKVHSEEVNDSKLVQVDISSLPKGIYVYQIMSTTGVLKSGKINIK